VMDHEQRGWTAVAGERAASGLRDLSRRVRALADGRPEDAGVAGDYVRRTGEQLQQVAERLESGGVEGAVSDLRGFARRRPGAFLLGALATGFAVGYLVRGGQAAEPKGPRAIGPVPDEDPVPEVPAAVG
jgi:hypothetical protein